MKQNERKNFFETIFKILEKYFHKKCKNFGTFSFLFEKNFHKMKKITS